MIRFVGNRSFLRYSFRFDTQGRTSLYSGPVKASSLQQQEHRHTTNHRYKNYENILVAIHGGCGRVMGLTVQKTISKSGPVFGGQVKGAWFTWSLRNPN